MIDQHMLVDILVICTLMCEAGVIMMLWPKRVTKGGVVPEDYCDAAKEVGLGCWEFTRVDKEGVPELLQGFSYNDGLRAYDCKLFNGDTVHLGADVVRIPPCATHLEYLDEVRADTAKYLQDHWEGYVNT